MGLKPILSNYELLVWPKEKNYSEFYLYFDKDRLVKVIEIGLNYMKEIDLNYVVKDKELLLPKTNRGKVKKLSSSVISNLRGEGTYFYIKCADVSKYGYVIIGNFTTQRTLFKDSKIANLNNYKDIKSWCDNYAKDASLEDIKFAQEFALAKVKHIKYREGDYFKVRLGKDLYTYGRIIKNVYDRRKNGELYWNVFMGKPLIIEIFHILTNNPNLGIRDLENLKTFPSMHIMDNKFYYGDYEIIGNCDLPNDLSYPIMYGKSIDAMNPNKLIFCCGNVYKEIPLNNNLIEREDEKDKPLFVRKGYRCNGIVFSINGDIDIMKECIQNKNNDAYYEFYCPNEDLRYFKNRDILKKVLKEFNLDINNIVLND